MKRSDDFVRDEDELYELPFMNSTTLFGQMKDYEHQKEELEELLQKKKHYDELLEDKTISEDELSFKEQWDLYSIVKDLNDKSFNGKYLNIDVSVLEYRLSSLFSNVSKYEYICNLIKNRKEDIHNILSNNITFTRFYNDFDEHCMMCGHYLVKFDDELKCMHCGTSTKDYNLSKEEVDFLTLCAKEQNELLENVTKEDLPLLQVLIDRQNYARNRRINTDFATFTEEDYDLYYDEFENQCLSDDAEFPIIRKKIAQAHLLDSKNYDNKLLSQPKYLSDEKIKELLFNVEIELQKAINSVSNYRDFKIEECKTAKYEILILSGKHLPTLIEETNEEDMFALTKAYYNISNQLYRQNSEYFTSIDAISYNCLTANEKINNKILEMRIKR